MGALDGKKALITGGGQGIGLGISKALVAAGAEILVAQRSRPAGELDAHWIEADLSAAHTPAAIAEAVERHWGRLDILVNNAGFMFESSLAALEFDDWNRMLAVNLTAPVFLSRALLPMLRDGGGSIVNIGSIEGLAANPGHIAYCTTKGGVHALTRAMAVDLGEYGIRVNAIAPGWIRSELSDNYINAQADPDAAWEGLYRMHPAGRVGEPADVGQLAVYLAGDGAAFVTGQVIVIDGGRTSKLPLPF
jgi:meso-butanediol dehydrogenase/(S,S)-butanediol dehydrogenase/diacetyl reductase